MTDIKFKFDGNISDNHVLDFYDASRAMVGFQRLGSGPIKMLA